MRSISIPAYIQSIGESGFEQCYQLKMLVLPRGLDTINDHMLSYCKSLESISIPYTVSGSSGSGGKSEGGDDSSSGSKTGGSGSRVLNEGVVWNGRVTASSLNVRTWAGTENPVVSFSPLKKGTKIGVCDELKAQGHEKWYYIEFKGRHGFVCGKYVERV